MHITKKLFSAVCLCAALIFVSGCGHQWLEADCVNPKTCAECGAVDGTPLGHMPAGANYQQAAVCLRCGESIGSPLPAEFVRRSVAAFDASGELGDNSFDYICAGCADGEAAPSPDTFSSASVSLHEAVIVNTAGDILLKGSLETEDPQIIELQCSDLFFDNSFRQIRERQPSGYEWRCIALEMVFSGDNFMRNGFYFASSLDDWYDPVGWSGSAEKDELNSFVSVSGWECMCHTVNYFGEVMPVYSLVKYEQENYALRTVLTEYLFVYMPAGYDGAVVSLLNAQDLINGTAPGTCVLDYADNDTLFFRLR